MLYFYYKEGGIKVYRLKEGMYEKIKEMVPNFKVKELADKIGIKSTFTSLIINLSLTTALNGAHLI